MPSGDILGILSVNLTLPNLKPTDFQKISQRGDLFSFRVLEKGPNGNYTLSLLGRKILARSVLSLPLGTVLQARAFRAEGTLRLELLKAPPSLESLFQNIGAKDRMGAEEVVRGLMQSGAALSPRIIRRILAYTTKVPRKRQLFARLAGALARKGVDLSQSGWEAVIETCLSDDYRRGEEEGSLGKEKYRQEEEEVPDVPAIKRMWAPKDAPNPLHLYNHIKSTGENWLFLPISSRLGGRKLTGSVEVQIGGDGKMGKAFIRVKDEGQDWFFRLSPLNRENRRILSWIRPEDRMEGRSGELEEFSEKLRNLGIDFDDTLGDRSEEDIPSGGVDWMV